MQEPSRVPIIYTILLLFQLDQRSRKGNPQETKNILKNGTRQCTTSSQMISAGYSPAR
jgi:hypothetical protein